MQSLISIGRDQKVGYVTNLADMPGNRSDIVDLCRDADLLFIEASIAAADAARAAERAHLTTKATGDIARRCGARRMEPLHFSPRYADCESMLLEGAAVALAGRST